MKPIGYKNLKKLLNEGYIIAHDMSTDKYYLKASYRIKSEYYIRHDTFFKISPELIIARSRFCWNFLQIKKENEK